MNVPILDNINGDKFSGYGRAQGIVDEGRKMSTSKAFLSPIKNGSNFYVIKSTRVDSILLKGTQVVRVRAKDGRSIEVKASKEVILSVDSIGSLQLLMSSDIEPKEHLHEIGILNIVDLPVGKNLQNHVVWFGLLLTFENQNATPSSSAHAY